MEKKSKNMGSLDMVDSLKLCAGGMSDYLALSHFHYLSNQPVTATKVLKLINHRPTVVGRYLQRDDLSQTVGVLVESYPALNCSLRDLALDGRYEGWSDRRAGAKLLNKEMRCISRVVIHPQWRGMGLAVKLVGEALATMTTPYVEALAAMGQVHPFFKRAGMAEYKRWPHRKDQRFIDVMGRCGVEPWKLASVRQMVLLLNGDGSLGDGDIDVAWLKYELGCWAGRRLSLDEQLIKARDKLLREPIYYLKVG